MCDCVLQSLEEALRCEQYEADSLRTRTAEMAESGGQPQLVAHSQQLLGQYDQTADRVKVGLPPVRNSVRTLTLPTTVSVILR